MFELSSNDKAIINNLVELISKIDHYLNKIKSYKELEKEDKSLDAVLMNFIVIGEMVSRLSTDLRKQFNKVPWQKIKNLRNIIAHNYFGVDPEEVWQIAKDELPRFKKELNEILK